MLKFTGEYKCKIDSNKRIKLPQRLIEDFIEVCNGEIVMHSLAEGALALYPEATFKEMRANEVKDADRIGNSILARRSARRFGALTKSENITAQGRVTIPASFCQRCELIDDVVVVGVEIGIEIWNATKWLQELDAINNYADLKANKEIEESLI